jgi:hypothetical protein
MAIFYFEGKYTKIIGDSRFPIPDNFVSLSDRLLFAPLQTFEVQQQKLLR